MHGAYSYLHLLEPDGTIRRVANDDEARACTSAEATRIGRDEVDGQDVSTVFLNVEHYGGMWFETMIFGGPHDEWCDRYPTFAVALEGHYRVVAALREGNAPGDGS